MVWTNRAFNGSIAIDKNEMLRESIMEKVFDFEMRQYFLSRVMLVCYSFGIRLFGVNQGEFKFDIVMKYASKYVLLSLNKLYINIRCKFSFHARTACPVIIERLPFKRKRIFRDANVIFVFGENSFVITE